MQGVHQLTFGKSQKLSFINLQFNFTLEIDGVHIINCLIPRAFETELHYSS